MIKVSQLCISYNDVFKFLDNIESRYKHLPIKWWEEVSLIDVSEENEEFDVAFRVVVTITNADVQKDKRE